MAAAAATAADPTLVLDWAEYDFSELFPDRAGNRFADPFTSRHYEQTHNYLGIWGTEVWGLGPGLNAAVPVRLADLSELQCWLAGSGCAQPVPRIAAPLQDLTVAAGSRAVLGISVEGDAAARLQWQRSSDGGATYVDVPGATQRTLDLGAATPSQSGQRFRVIVSNAAHRRVSNAARLSVVDLLAQTAFIVSGPPVTANDSGFNDFSSNRGALDSRYGNVSLDCADGAGNDWSERLDWDFPPDAQAGAFTGRFESLMGLTDTPITRDGRTIEKVRFDEHVLDLGRIDGALVEPGGPRSADSVCWEYRYAGASPLALRAELKDPEGGARYTRIAVAPGTNAWQVHCWTFRAQGEAINRIGDAGDLNPARAKVLSYLVEREHVADRVRNPDTGRLHVRRSWLGLNRGDAPPADDELLLELLSRRTYQYFIDWSSHKPASRGLPQDRSQFNDLITVGGAGIAFASHVVAAERGWITCADAAARVLDMLLVLDNGGAFGSAAIGHIGHRGFFYHFFDAETGRRKINYDHTTTPEVNEALSTVELSPIDTALAVTGALIAQSYFNGSDAVDSQIRGRVQSICDRVEWNWALAPHRQFYLGAKPIERRDGAAFAVPDATGLLHFSGTAARPATLDYYTDEALLMILLGVGSQTHGVASDVYCALVRQRDAAGLVKTFSGSAFTFFLVSSFIDPRSLNAFAACPGETRVDWFANTRLAFERSVAEVLANPRGFAAYGGHAYGISAAEGPADLYHAYGLPSLAVNQAPEQDGTITYYATLAALPFGAELRRRALLAVRDGFAKGHFHTRFGLADAFNDDISQGAFAFAGSPQALRRQGRWVGRAGYAIDGGPMLLAIENARTGLVWRLAAANANLQRALERLAAPQQLVLQAEGGAGGSSMFRSNAGGGQTQLLRAGASVRLALTVPGPGRYAVRLRYSNDNFGPLEQILVTVNGTTIGQGSAQDTGDFGAGWNSFLDLEVGSVVLAAGSHLLSVAAAGGDGFGVEIDAVTLRRLD